MRVELQLFGRFSASVAGAPPRSARISAPRQRALLAYLAMRPDYSETRERLADLLWGDRPDRQARQSLRQCLVSLRKELEPLGIDLLKAEGDSIALRAELLSIDARELLRAMENGAGDHGTDTLELQRGEFLEGIELPGEPFQAWLQTERRRLNAAAAEFYWSRALSEDRAGRRTNAVAAAERLIAIDPMSERHQLLLLRLTAQHQGQSAARARAETLAAHLRREFDAEPEAAALALIERVRGDRAPTALDGPAHDPAEKRQSERPDNAMPDGTTGVAAPSKARKNLARAAERSLLAVLGVAGLLLLTSDWGAPSGGAKPPASESSWRSPALYAGGGVIDRTALEAQGRYAMIVLPFAVADGAPSGDRAAADQISDDLIDDLSRVSALRVISRSTSRLFRQDALDVAALGAELGVRYVVEGRVASEGSTFRVDVALSDATTRLLVWSERFERDRAEQAVLQDDISLAIARALQLSVIGSEDSRHRLGTSGDAQVATLLAEGWAAMLHIGTSGTGSGADADFTAVLERDPENVSALIGRGAYDVSVVAMFLVPDREKRIARAEDALDHAIRNDPDASLAYYFLGILHKIKGAPRAALSNFSKAIQLNPSFAPAYAQLGHVLSRLGRQDEALEHIRYAIRLSPRDPNLGLWSLFGGEIELERGHDEAAVEWLRRAATLDPTSPFMHAALAATLALRGDQTGSAREAEEVRRLAPWLTQEQMQERLIGLSESGSEPQRLLRGLHLAFAQPKQQ